MKRTSIRLAAIMVAAVLALSGCSAEGNSAGEPDILKLSIASPPLSLDPAKGNAGEPEVLLDLAYSTLIRGHSDGTFTPEVAESFEYVGEGNTQFKVTLRPDVKFADGEDLDSAAVKAYLEYFRDAKGPQSNNMNYVESIETPDDLTVILNLNAPNPDLPLLLSEGVLLGSIVSPTGLKDPDALGTSTHGAGPYQLDTDRTVTGSSYVLVPNKNYYDPERQKWDEVVITVISDQNAALQSVISGQTQWTTGSFDQIDAAKAAGLNIGYSVPTDFTLYLQDRAGINFPALGDERVRQALNFATDRKTIAEVLNGTPVAQIVPEGPIGYNPEAEKVYDYNPERARELLAEAGYGDGFSFSVIVGSYDHVGVRLAELLAEQFAAVGVTLQIEQAATFPDWARGQESATYGSTIYNLGSSLFFVGQTIVLPEGILNPYDSSDDELNSLYVEASSLSGEEAKAAFEKFSLRVTEKAWFVPVVAIPSVFFSSGDIDPGAGDGASYPNPLYF